MLHEVKNTYQAAERLVAELAEGNTEVTAYLSMTSDTARSQPHVVITRDAITIRTTAPGENTYGILEQIASEARDMVHALNEREKK